MMCRFFRRSPTNRSIASLYGTIVAQARAAPFYRIYGGPDTVNGRFEAVVRAPCRIPFHDQSRE
jgi:cytochrome b pre-mRNA-processing protein 3